MTNLRKMLSKLVEACNSTSEVEVFINANNTVVNMFDYSGPAFHDSWYEFASALRDIKEMIIQSCNVSNITSASATSITDMIIQGSNVSNITSASAINITELNLNGDNNGIGFYSFIGGFMSGVLAASLIVASYYLLKKVYY
ncbi:hypothetical protein K6025_05200 [Ehrlichia sp. JZT12]